MSSFRTKQNDANTNKLNNILLTLIVILILNLALQIWLLYTALNYALDDNKEVATYAFVASFGIFIIGAVWLYFLPQGKSE